MSKKRLIKSIAAIILCVFFLQSSAMTFVNAEPAGATQGQTQSSSKGILDSISQFRKESYEQYLEKYKSQPTPDEEIIIDAKDFTKAEGMNVEILHNFQGAQKDVIKTSDEGMVEWEVDVKTTGLYNIGIKYYPIEGKTSTIERELRIDGEVPFEGARVFMLQRIWKNSTAIQGDSRGNQFRPTQVEAPQWREVAVGGTQGYSIGNYQFYFTAGKHTIQFVSVKEPVVIEHIKLFQEESVPSYSDMKAMYQKKGYEEVSTDEVDIVKIQGENGVYKSDSTLSPANDRSSPLNEPFSVANIKINAIGGLNWKYPKQWITWEVDVPKDGLYKLGIRALQNFSEGTYSSRKLYIDDKVPFKEAETIEFTFDRNWQMIVPGGDEPYLFYLTKGKHDIKLENTLGQIADVLRIIEDSVLELNDLYREILMVTSAAPDKNRDYNIQKTFPQLQETFARQRDNLYKARDLLIEITGGAGNDSARLEKLAIQLKSLANDPELITKVLDNFKINVANVASWILTATEEPLLIDYLAIAPPQADMPRADASWWEKLATEFKGFLVSFVNDYSIIEGASVGEDGKAQKSVSLWIGTGRDQAQVMKLLGDNYFAPKTGIKLDVRLVDMGILLPSVAAGKGPDVAINIGQKLPVDYALRSAVLDLTQFTDYQEVLKRFAPSAATPFWIDDSLYALPETQTFPMLFYRKDILADMGVDVPQTWDDVYALVPILQKHRLDIGLPTVMDDDTGGALNGTYLMFLFQNDGQIYNENHTKSVMDNSTGITAFTKWSELYTNYKVTQKFDGLQRFRTGEIPVMISGFNFYNSLSLLAPEIRGLWDFTLAPGTKMPDGSIRREVGSASSATVILRNAKDKDSAWAFLKWWTDEETQLRYGLEMEGLQGPSARVPTANIEAFWKLPWSSSAASRIQEQRKWVVGVPEVPGGYMASRNLENAVRQVINEGTSPRETLIDWNKFTNDEIRIKRTEFGMNLE